MRRLRTPGAPGKLASRRTGLWVTFAILLTLSVTGCNPLGTLNELSEGDHYSVEGGLSSGPAPRQVLDVYEPHAPMDSAPVVVFFYGGGWRKGEKADYTFVATALTEAGFTVVIPDYRFFPEVQFPTFVEDGAAAIACWSTALMTGWWNPATAAGWRAPSRRPVSTWRRRDTTLAFNSARGDHRRMVSHETRPVAFANPGHAGAVRGRGGHRCAPTRAMLMSGNNNHVAGMARQSHGDLATDLGETRNPDQQGFAAFGRVVRGIEVVRAIHALPADAPSDDPYKAGQIIEEPVVIRTVRLAAEP